MSDVTAPELRAPAAPALPLRDIGPYAILVVAVAMALWYLVGVEEGATAIFKGMLVHEWVHDARHLLGFPCH